MDPLPGALVPDIATNVALWQVVAIGARGFAQPRELALKLLAAGS